jgi:hypothetical protein
LLGAVRLLPGEEVNEDDNAYLELLQSRREEAGRVFVIDAPQLELLSPWRDEAGHATDTGSPQPVAQMVFDRADQFSLMSPVCYREDKLRLGGELFEVGHELACREEEARNKAEKARAKAEKARAAAIRAERVRRRLCPLCGRSLGLLGLLLGRDHHPRCREFRE